MQEFLTTPESQPTPRPDELRDGAEIMLRLGRDGLLSVEDAREAAKQAGAERQRPLGMHEEISILSQRLRYLRTLSMAENEESDNFALWKQELTEAHDFAQWERELATDSLSPDSQAGYELTGRNS